MAEGICIEERQRQIDSMQHCRHTILRAGKLIWYDFIIIIIYPFKELLWLDSNNSHSYFYYLNAYVHYV